MIKMRLRGGSEATAHLSSAFSPEILHYQSRFVDLTVTLCHKNDIVDLKPCPMWVRCWADFIMRRKRDTVLKKKRKKLHISDIKKIIVHL